MALPNCETAVLLRNVQRATVGVSPKMAPPRSTERFSVKVQSRMDAATA
jgi:hypothetical protein